MREIAVDFVYSLKTNNDLMVTQNVWLNCDKIYVIIACCEDIYGRFCIKKRNNDHFHP